MTPSGGNDYRPWGMLFRLGRGIDWYMPARLGVLAYRSGEVLCYAAGIVLSGFFLVQLAQGEVQRQSGIAEFERLAQADTSVAVVADNPASTDSQSSEPA